jgi:CheY-like chemotaxis protein
MGVVEEDELMVTERSGRPVLIVENDARQLTIYDRYLRGSAFRLVPARSLREARRALASELPHAIVLDVLLEGEDTWKFLADLKKGETTRDIPVLVVSTVDDSRKGLALGADAYALKPAERGWLIGELERLTRQSPVPGALIIDDDDMARYVLKRLLSQLHCVITEMPNGKDGLQAARELRPEIVFLDLNMPNMSGAEVLVRLKEDPVTANIPVVVVTSKVLEPAERAQLESRAVAVLSKDETAREDALSVIQATWVKAGLRL